MNNIHDEELTRRPDTGYASHAQYRAGETERGDAVYLDHDATSRATVATLSAELRQAYENLGAVQRRCGELLEQNRELRGAPPTLQVRLSDGAIAPTYGSDGAAGLDLSAPRTLLPTAVLPGERLFIDTGVAMEIPSGHWGHVLGRSGLARKHGLAVLGGVIDSDYRGTIGVILHNTGTETFVVEPGMRIAQIVVAPVTTVSVAAVTSLGSTARGGAGFGSTGVGPKEAA